MSSRKQRPLAAIGALTLVAVCASCSDDTTSVGPDLTAPAAVVLTAGAPTDRSVTLTWTAPGDDSLSGTAAAYRLRYAATPVTSVTWANARRVDGLPVPSPAGRPDSMIVTGLDWSTTYYFALQTTDDDGNASALSNSPSATTLLSETITACVSCHGNESLVKTITIPGKPSQTVPLYVELAAYLGSTHRSLECTQCHTDIRLTNGTHAGVAKGYGGWARYSASQAIAYGQSIPAGQEDTRNYHTAAALSCAQTGCHANHASFANSAHRTIYKLRGSSVRTVAGHAVGEAYVTGNCNRCHATCATCHFESRITRADTTGDDIANHWEEIQANGEGAVANASALTEYAMDWTTNVRTHTFRTPDWFLESNEVCRACHIGYARPTAWGFYELPEGGVDSLRATGLRRHPQYQELTRGTSAHRTLTCARCHTDVHALPGAPYVWAAAGDAQCTNCHAGHNTFHRSVACIGCHTGGLARDVGQTDGHSVWVDPVTRQVRPVIVKYSEPITWYTHNWSTAEGTCVTRCHYAGNRVGALPLAGGTPNATGLTIPRNQWFPVLRALGQTRP